jgi:tRNA (cmo5U34)-methyltransferase
VADEKRSLFARIRAVLAPGGRFVLADVIVPDDPGDAVTSLTPGWDNPSTLGEQLRWLGDEGFGVEVTWVHRDLAVVCADSP